MRRGILATRDELKALKERISLHPYEIIYETLRRRCSLILEAAPVTEAQWRSLWQQGVWGSALLAARTTQGRIMDLLIAHHIEPNAAYRNRAVEELMKLAAWTTWVDPCHAPAESPDVVGADIRLLAADLCTAEAAVGAVVGLDWLWEDLSGPDRIRVLQAIRTKAIEPYRKAVREQAWWYTSYTNWNAVVNSGCGLAALALGDEEPAADEACQWARKGLKGFCQALGREGGWNEGLGYWGFAMRYLLLFGEAVSRLLGDQKLLRWRGMDATGLFGVYFTPNGRSASFGDYPAVPLHGALYLLVKYFGLKELTWWLDAYSFQRDVSTSGWSAAGLAMLLRPPDAESPKLPDLQPLRIFHEIGWAAMADTWPRPRLYVAAKTGDLSANHSQRDMNSIQMQVDGEMLLVDLGHPPYSRQYFSDQRGEFYEVQAKAHNTIVVGQRDHLIEAQGSILEAESGQTSRWLAMDSSNACGEDVRFVRHVVMIFEPTERLGETVVVFDEVDSGSPEQIDLYWHTFGKIDADCANLTGIIRGEQTAVQFALASTAKATVATETYELSSRRRDNVLHLTCGAVGKAYLASVFSRRRSAAKLRLVKGAKEVRVVLGDLCVSFKSTGHHMQLAGVRRGKAAPVGLQR